MLDWAILSKPKIQTDRPELYLVVFHLHNLYKYHFGTYRKYRFQKLKHHFQTCSNKSNWLSGLV